MKNFIIFKEKSVNLSTLGSIREKPSTPPGNGMIPNKTLVNLNDLNESNLFRRRKITMPNAHAAHLRVVNNIRMQRACRYSMKKLAINNIVEHSNSQRTFTGDTVKIGGFNYSSEPSNKNNLAPTPMTTSTKTKHVSNSNRNGAALGASSGGAIPYRNIALMMNNPNVDSSGSSDLDFKIFQFKKQQAELKRNQLEDDLKENHPYFDKPLFLIGRESNFRKFCQMIVEARYIRGSGSSNNQQKENTNVNYKDQYKQIHKFLGMVSYLDWIMITVTIQSCIGMWFETPNVRLVESIPLQIVEYVFVICMGIEMTLKVCAYGLFFTPNAVVKDFGGILDLFIFTVSFLFLYLSPREVVANSGAQLIMLMRCLRPLRIFTLVPHMRKVIYELCRGFKEILLVSILLVVLIFIFANYSIQMYGGK